MFRAIYSPSSGCTAYGHNNWFLLHTDTGTWPGTRQNCGKRNVYIFVILLKL